MSIFNRRSTSKRETSLDFNFQMHGVLPGPRYSTDPQIEKKLSEWTKLSAQGLRLVHAISTDQYRSSVLTRMPADEVFKTWDVFSTSLVVHPTTEAGWHRKPLEMFAAVALVLKVPPENILGTFNGDVFFPTHETAENNRFARSVLSGRSVYKNGVFGRRHYIKGGYNRIETPEWVASRTYTYNEVLVVGKPGFKLHYAVTKPIKVTGILCCHNCRMSERDLPWERAALLRALREVNHHLPVNFV